MSGLEICFDSGSESMLAYRLIPELMAVRIVTKQNGCFMQKDKTKTKVAALVITGALLVLYLLVRVPGPNFEPKPFQAVGQVLAGEAGRLRGADGSITVLTRDTKLFNSPALDAQLKAFTQGLQNAKLPTTRTNLFMLDPLRPALLPPGDLFEILRKLGDTDVVVSFIGPPVLTANQEAKLPANRPKVVAVCTGDTPLHVDLRGLFERNLLHAAILSIPDASSRPPQSNSQQLWFDHYYKLVTKDNLSELPQPPMRHPR